MVVKIAWTDVQVRGDESGGYIGLAVTIKERKGCLKKLLDAGTLDQAIVFASETEQTKINKAGVATYWVEAGKVSAL